MLVQEEGEEVEEGEASDDGEKSTDGEIDVGVLFLTQFVQISGMFCM